MSLTTLTLLGNTTYGTPSGNYDGSTPDFISDPVRGVGYYRGQGNIQTVWIYLTGFQGTITLQATLDQDPADAGWFDVYNYGDADSATTGAHPVALTGNFVWIRAQINDFSAGTIDSITVTY